MCLTVDLKKHIHIFNKALPKIALKDINVYKVVGVKYGYFYSPYQITPIIFIKNKAILKSSLQQGSCKRDKTFSGNRLYIEIYKGIHGYTEHKFACEDAVFLEDTFINRAIICKAIIPRGTKYYLGVDGDIVAKKLIIYK